MKIIETRWKGYRFRSRTEARWAVFLEAANINFEYEPEGVVLPSGPYLPDFRLTRFDLPEGCESQEVWLEIKGGEPSEAERLKCAELAVASGAPVLLAVGAPDFATQVFLFDLDDGAAGSCPPRMSPVAWCNLLSLLIGPLAIMNVGGPGDETIVVGRGPREPQNSNPGGPDASPDMVDAFNKTWAVFDDIFCRVLGMKDGRLPHGEAYIGLGPRLKAAYDKARSARFEHGQTDQRWRT